MQRHRYGRMLGGVTMILAVAGMTASTAGQVEAEGGIKAPLAPPIPSVQGVKSKAPSPIGIGRKGTLLDRKGTLLPPAPVVVRRPVDPFRRPIVTVRSGGLVRRGVTHVIDIPGGSGRRVAIGPGFVAHGRFDDDHFRFGFHLGSGVTAVPVWKPWHFPHRRFIGTSGFWLNPGAHYRPAYDYSYYTQPVFGHYDPFLRLGIPLATYIAMQQQAAMAQQAPAPYEPTTLEQADALLMLGEAKRAVTLYRKYLDDAPDDANVMRSLAVGLLDTQRFDQAVAVMAMAYAKQPRLARTPIDVDLLGADAAAVRRKVTATVGYANRVRTSSAWLLVAAVIQAEGRDDVAMRMVEKAREAGLAEEVAAEFESSLAPVSR